MTPLLNLRACQEFPQVSQDVDASMALLYSPTETVQWLAYEVARDFLSVPRQFVILEIEMPSDQVIALNSDYQYDGIEYLEDGSMAQRGLFEISDEQEGLHHFVLSLAQERCEWLCTRMQPVGRVTQAANAAMALRQWLVRQSL